MHHQAVQYWYPTIADRFASVGGCVVTPAAGWVEGDPTGFESDGSLLGVARCDWRVVEAVTDRLPMQSSATTAAMSAGTSKPGRPVASDEHRTGERDPVSRAEKGRDSDHGDK